MKHSCYKFKKLLFFQENPLECFITVSSGVSISPLIFTTVFRVFLLLIVFVRYFSFVLIAFIHFTNFLYTDSFFLPDTSFLYCCTWSATDLRELFLLSGGVFYLTLLPDIWHTLLLSRLPWEPAVFP